MARNAAEAHRMADTAHRHPDLVKQIVPSPFGLVQNDYVRDMLRDGFFGDIREVVVIGANDAFANSETPLHWRQEIEKSGYNVLALGILHESLLRWAPPPVSVLRGRRRSPRRGRAETATPPGWLRSRFPTACRF